MAVLHDAVSSNYQPFSWTSKTVNHTVAGTNRYLLVGVVFRQNNSQTISTVTYNGVAATFLGGVTNGGIRTEMWGLKNPDTGANDCVVTPSASIPAGSVVVRSANNVNQTTPTGTVVTASGQSVTPSVTVVGATGDLTVDVTGVRSSSTDLTSFAVGAGQTERAKSRTGLSTTDTWQATSDQAGAASVVMDWTISEARFWAAVGVALKDAGGGASMTITPVGFARQRAVGSPTIQGGLPVVERHVAVGGNDTNAGSQQAPWATVAHAIDNTPAGGRIWVHAGDWPKINAIGVVKSARTYISAWPGDIVRLIDGWHLSGSQNLVIDGFDVATPTANLAQIVENCWDCIISNCEPVSQQGARWWWNYNTGGGGRNAVENCYFHDMDAVITDPGGNGPTMIAMRGVGPGMQGFAVRGCRAERMHGWDFCQVSSARNRAARVMDVLIENNDIDDVNKGSTIAHADFFQATGFTGNCIIRNNRLRKARGPIIQPNTGANTQTPVGDHTNLQIYNNEWAEYTDFSVTIYNSPGFRFYNNTVATSSRVVSTSSADWNTGCRINYLWGGTTDGDPTSAVVLKNNILDELVITSDLITFAAKGQNLINVISGYAGGNSYTLDPTDKRGIPVYVDFNNRDLHLQANTLGVDMADPAWAPVTDRLGHARTSVPDIGSLESGGTIQPPAPIEIHNWSRKTIYPVAGGPLASPASPGVKPFNEFCGLFTLLDGSVVLPFVESYGAVPGEAQRAPQVVYDRLGIARTPTSWPATRDFWSLTNRIRYLRSTDNGDTWSVYLDESLDIHSDGAWSGAHLFNPVEQFPQPHICTPAGTWLKRVNGEDARYDQNTAVVPGKTAFCMRRAGGVAGTWFISGTGNHRFFNVDPTLDTAQFARFLTLHQGASGQDAGNILAVGQIWKGQPAGTRKGSAGLLPALRVSSDDGTSWSDALVIPNGSVMLAANEWDVVELPTGDLFAMFRTGAFPWVSPQPISTQYAQVLLRKIGPGQWQWTTPTKPSFSTTTQPIYPELMLDKTTGAIFFFSRAPEGVWKTEDVGKTWTRPVVKDVNGVLVAGNYVTNYYPRTVQLNDNQGTVICVSHFSTDDDFNEFSQFIQRESFFVTGGTVVTPPADLTLRPVGFTRQRAVGAPTITGGSPDKALLNVGGISRIRAVGVPEVVFTSGPVDTGETVPSDGTLGGEDLPTQGEVRYIGQVELKDAVPHQIADIFNGEVGGSSFAIKCVSGPLTVGLSEVVNSANGWPMNDGETVSVDAQSVRRLWVIGDVGTKLAILVA